MNKIFYRAVIVTQGAAGLPLWNLGYLTDAEQVAYTAEAASAIVIPAAITSLNTAVAKGMAQLRRFQSDGLDCSMHVMGLVADDNVANVFNSGNVASGRALPGAPVRALTGTEPNEQTYAQIDTPERGLTVRIQLSNRDSTAGLPANLGGDYAEDTQDVQTNTI